MSDPCYAVFRFNSEIMRLTEYQFKQAVADGRICRCNFCLACRASEYHLENYKGKQQ